MYCFGASKPVISSRRFQLYVIVLGVSMLAIQLEEVNGQTSKYFSMYYSVNDAMSNSVADSTFQSGLHRLPARARN